MWLSAPMITHWIFALRAFHLITGGLGLLEKDVLCATMAVRQLWGLIWFSWVFLLIFIICC